MGPRPKPRLHRPKTPQPSNLTRRRRAVDARGLIRRARGLKAKAATGGNAIYTLALLPVPATPTPVPPPGTPSDFVAALNPDGSLKLRWKCANPAGSSGTIYQVSRKVGIGGFNVVGGTGTRSFDDATVPAGVAAQFVVNFGVTGSGEAVASVVSAPKLAA